MNILKQRYIFKKDLVFRQNRYKKLVDTSFPSSRELAIIIADKAEPENNSPIPRIEKYAEQDAINIAENPTIFFNEKRFFIYVLLYITSHTKTPNYFNHSLTSTDRIQTYS